MYITKETKWQLSCRCHDNSYAAGPVLIKIKIPRFHLTQGSYTNNLMGRVKTMWEPCLFRGRPPCPTQKGCKGGYLFFQRKRLEPRVLPWQQNSRCHSVSFVMYITWLQYFGRYSGFSILLFMWNHLWRHHFPLISARPQRQTSVRGCWIFEDLDQLKSKYTTKNGRLIPMAKRGQEIKRQWREIKTSTISLPDISVWNTNLLRGHFLLAPAEGLYFKPKYRANILYLF